jgi:hypothetical protein
MSLKEIERQAVALPQQERVSLIETLLQTRPAPGQDLSDEGVLERDREIENGSVQEISHEEFVRRVEKARRK